MVSTSFNGISIPSLQSVGNRTESWAPTSELVMSGLADI